MRLKTKRFSARSCGWSRRRTIFFSPSGRSLRPDLYSITTAKFWQENCRSGMLLAAEVVRQTQNRKPADLCQEWRFEPLGAHVLHFEIRPLGRLVFVPQPAALPAQLTGERYPQMVQPGSGCFGGWRVSSKSYNSISSGASIPGNRSWAWAKRPPCARSNTKRKSRLPKREGGPKFHDPWGLGLARQTNARREGVRRRLRFRPALKPWNLWPRRHRFGDGLR